MKNQFEILKATRNNLLNVIQSLSLEELNKVPQNFNNNIIWNIAHVVVTQQLLCYGLSNNSMLIPSELIEENRKGTAPNKQYSQEEVDFWKTQVDQTHLQMEKDYNANFFNNFTEYPTSYNVNLTSIDEAISFNNIHEALHLGYIMALKKAIIEQC